MSEAPLERRISAILALDIAGYTRLMGDDEVGTFRRAQDKLTNVIGPHLERAGGRLFKTTGDGALVEFLEAAASVRAAISIQHENEAIESALPVERRMRLRVGISLGEVIVHGGDLFGDGVNLAARLEGAAEVGGIAVSEAIAQAAEGCGATFLELGLVPLKNVGRPLRVYKVAMAGETAALSLPPGQSLVRGFGERPAIAVLPLQPQPAGQSSEYLADGFTEELISALARWRSFPVISRNSVFAFKSKTLELPFVAQQLGARYVTEGTMRSLGSRVRTFLQLHDVETMDVLFSESYETDLDNAAAGQDDMVRTIVGAIEPELVRRERDRIESKTQHSSTAYEFLQRGNWHHYRYTPQGSQQARAFFRNALAIDPNYSQAAAALSLTLSHAAQARWEDDPKAARQEALEQARLAIQADARNPHSHFALGIALYHMRAVGDAIGRLQETIRLNPSHAAAHANLAFCLNYQNRPQEALAEVSLALRLSPHDPRRFLWLPALAGAHYLSGDYRAALRAGQEALAANSNYLPVARYVVAAFGQIGETAAAAAAMPLLRRLDTDLAAAEAHLGEYFVPAATAHIVEGLTRAGFT